VDDNAGRRTPSPERLKRLRVSATSPSGRCAVPRNSRSGAGTSARGSVDSGRDLHDHHDHHRRNHDHGQEPVAVDSGRNPRHDRHDHGQGPARGASAYPVPQFAAVSDDIADDLRRDPVRYMLGVVEDARASLGHAHGRAAPRGSSAAAARDHAAHHHHPTAASHASAGHRGQRSNLAAAEELALLVTAALQHLNGADPAGASQRAAELRAAVGGAAGSDVATRIDVLEVHLKDLVDEMEARGLDAGPYLAWFATSSSSSTGHAAAASGANATGSSLSSSAAAKRATAAKAATTATARGGSTLNAATTIEGAHGSAGGGAAVSPTADLAAAYLREMETHGIHTATERLVGSAQKARADASSVEWFERTAAEILASGGSSSVMQRRLDAAAAGTSRSRGSDTAIATSVPSSGIRSGSGGSGSGIGGSGSGSGVSRRVAAHAHL
jgi:hypothetical protein